MKLVRTNGSRLGLILTLIVITASVAGCASALGTGWHPVVVRNTGRVVRETRALSSFDQVTVSGAFHLELEQGDAESLLIEADEAMLPYISSQVMGHDLNLGYTRPLRLFDPDQIVRLVLTVRDIDALSFSGAGKIYSKQLATERIEITLSGAGQILIDDLRAQDLIIRLSGAGDIRLAGQVVTQDVQLSGVGQYSASALESRDAAIRISGLGQAKVWVEDTLSTDATFPTSRIQVHGNPRLVGGSAQLVQIAR